jgi:hypothetical protein
MLRQMYFSANSDGKVTYFRPHNLLFVTELLNTFVLAEWKYLYI